MTDKKSKKGRLLVILGTVLLLAALSLVLWNNYRQQTSSKKMNGILSSLLLQMPQTDDDFESDNSGDFGQNGLNGDIFDFSSGGEASYSEEYIEVEQKRYIGILQIPSLGLELPIMADYSYAELYNSPCRYFGGIATSDIVIAAHNYRYFFGPIDNLNSGDKLIFTDVNGQIFTYSVVQSEIIASNDLNSLLANSDEWDMTLFTCTWSGTSRIVVRAQLDISQK